MISCQNCQELLPEFSMGELDAREQRKVKFHLNKCRKCAVELAAFRKVWNSLPYALEPVEPPQKLKLQLMDRVKSSPKSNKRKRGNERNVRHRPASSFRFDRKTKWYAFAASLLACLFTLNSLIWGGDDGSATNESLFADSVARQRVEAFAASVSPDTRVVGQDGMLNFVYVSMQRDKSYNTVDTSPEAYAVWNRLSDKWHVFLKDISQVAERKNLKLWLQDSKGRMVASTNIQPQELGFASVVFDSFTGRPVVRALITVEKGAAKKPSSDVVFRADLITPVVPVAVDR